MRRALALVTLALALAAPAHAQIFGNSTPALLGDGSLAAPSYAYASSPTIGFFRGIFGMSYSNGGTGTVAFGDGLQFRNTGVLQWVTGTTAEVSGSVDATLKRAATNTLSITAGGATSTFANLGGVLLIEANNVVQSSVSQNLHSYTVPANVMSVNGKTLRVTALFLSVNNANAKAIGFTICGGSLTFNATVSIAGALRATAYITRTALNTWTTSVTIEEGLASGTLTQAKLSGTYNSTPACTDSATNTIAASVNTAGATDTSSGFFMVELLN